jgi:hypothetical protein
MNDGSTRLLIIFSVALFLVPLFPPASGDGMPVYTYVKDEEEARQLYSTTFESRQLANVELLNSTHQRIDLFLSIFSLDPSQNLTVLVPFRQLPEDVDMERTNDTKFLKEIGYDRIVSESSVQDLGKTTGRFAERTGNGLKDLGTSTVTSPLGLLSLHVAEEYVLSSSGGDDYNDKEESGRDSAQANKEVKEVSHYDFDGASVSIYSVSANATLEDFISVVDLETLPTVTRDVVEEYKDQYVAVIETEPSPPIPEETYSWLMEIMPRTMKKIISGFEDQKRLSYTEVQQEIVQNSYEGFMEMVDSGYNTSGYDQEWMDRYYKWILEWEWNGDDTPFNILEKMESLFFAVYGFSDFQGHTLSVTTELDEGCLYFPLGTSKGWDNPIQDTIIIMRTPEENSLDLGMDPDHSAFIDDEHCYIVEYFDANPDEDLVGKVVDVGNGEKARASFSEFIHAVTGWAPFIVALLFQFVMWFLLVWAFKRTTRDSDLKVLSARNLVMGAMNILLSAPITYLLMVKNPLSGEEHLEGPGSTRIYNFTYLTYLVINTALFIWRVMV